MSLDADLLVDRRSLRRKLSFWRVLTFLAIAVAIIAVGFLAGGRNLLNRQQPHVARITVDGLITGDKPLLDVVRRVRTARNVQAVMVAINSPGGTTTGSEALYNELRELAKVKPTVAVVTGSAASGAYVTALGTERIFAPQTAVIGSIGVIIQYPNFVKTLEMLGVKVEAVRSSPLKAQPSGVEPTLPEARAALEATIADSYQWFKDLVKERRALSAEELGKVADGRVFTGRQSLPLKLIDEIGSEREARAWLEKDKKVAATLRVVDYKRASVDRFGLFSLAGIVSALGYGDLAVAISGARQSVELQTLDGLLSVWQPPAQN